MPRFLKIQPSRHKTPELRPRFVATAPPNRLSTVLPEPQDTLSCISLVWCASGRTISSPFNETARLNRIIASQSPIQRLSAAFAFAYASPAPHHIIGARAQLDRTPRNPL
ncbi:hypothetical protein B0H11DRAFT_2222789 [Mycena galericulata]|nr:hypothetical protein B0H11DRAFT_2222789 [Mycena galericulata]